MGMLRLGRTTAGLGMTWVRGMGMGMAEGMGMDREGEVVVAGTRGIGVMAVGEGMVDKRG
jgi:hypothetical protein